MRYTVRLCQDLGGWFATMSGDLPLYPGVRVHWAAGFENHDPAMAVLESAQALAHRLAEERATWAPHRAPAWS